MANECCHYENKEATQYSIVTERMRDPKWPKSIEKSTSIGKQRIKDFDLYLVGESRLDLP